MESFYLYVSIGALVILILMLIAIGVMMTKLDSYSPFPSIQSACPDYWDVSSNPSYCGIPRATTARNTGTFDFSGNPKKINQSNNINIGLCTGSSSFGCKSGGGDFLGLEVTPANPNFQYMYLGSDNANWNSATGLYPGKTTICAQRAWANMMGLSWDGVHNYNGC
jgi:hypothetical protein